MAIKSSIFKYLRTSFSIVNDADVVKKWFPEGESPQRIVIWTLFSIHRPIVLNTKIHMYIKVPIILNFQAQKSFNIKFSIYYKQVQPVPIYSNLLFNLSCTSTNILSLKLAYKLLVIDLWQNLRSDVFFLDNFLWNCIPFDVFVTLSVNVCQGKNKESCLSKK